MCVRVYLFVCIYFESVRACVCVCVRTYLCGVRSCVSEYLCVSVFICVYMFCVRAYDNTLFLIIALINCNHYVYS